MTAAQLRAARFLRDRPWATPAEIGYAIVEDRARRPGGMKAQGAGWIGGSIALAMVQKGLVEICTKARGGFPAYRLSPAGRAALATDDGTTP